MSRRYTVTVPDDLARWLDAQPHLDPGSLLQQAIREQRQAESSSGDWDWSQLGNKEIDSTHDHDVLNDDGLTVAKAYPNDAGRGIARLDPETLIDIGESVTVQWVETKHADRIVLTPPDEVAVQFDTNVVEMIWRQLVKRPVVEGDIVPFMQSTDHPFMRSSGEATPLITAETTPSGVVVVTDETTVELHID